VLLLCHPASHAEWSRDRSMFRRWCRFRRMFLVSGKIYCINVPKDAGARESAAMHNPLHYHNRVPPQHMLKILVPSRAKSGMSFMSIGACLSSKWHTLSPREPCRSSLAELSLERSPMRKDIYSPTPKTPPTRPCQQRFSFRDVENDLIPELKSC
jgi:hypothetical protein